MAGLRDVLRTFTRGVGKAALDAFQKAVEDEEQPAPTKKKRPPQNDGDEDDDGIPDAQDPSSDDGEGGDDEDQGGDNPDDSANPDDGSDDGADPLSDDTGDAPDTDDEKMPQSPLSLVHGEAETPQKQVPDKLAEIEEARTKPQSLFWDPYAVIDALGYKDRPSPMTFRTLETIVWRAPIIQAIHRTRIAQVSAFAAPQVDRYQTGYRVVLRDKKAKPTPASEARSQQIERWLQTTGTTEHPESRDDFETFLSKIVSDSLTYDQMTFEVVPSRKGDPAEFYAVDAATIRIADTTKLFIDPEDEEAIRYVQVYDSLPVAEYTAKQLCFGVRNPSPNIRLQGYGQSELEMLVQTITSLLWAWDYNQKFFSQGANAKGILNFQGVIPEKQMRAFRRHWYSMVAGVENAFRTPIMNSEGLQWVDIAKSNRDMEFSAWMDFLIKVASAVYLIDPMEVNFKYGDTGAKPMFESANQSKLTASKDKGLKPLLRFISRRISTHLVTALDPDFEFEFVGLDGMTPGEQADLNQKLVKSTRTIDELRALEDLPPLPNGMGDIILDPVFMQHMTTSAQQATGTGAFAPPQPPDMGDGGDDDPFSKLSDDLDNGDAGGDANKAPEFGSTPDKPAAAAKPAKPAAPSDKPVGGAFGKSFDANESLKKAAVKQFVLEIDV